MIALLQKAQMLNQYASDCLEDCAREAGCASESLSIALEKCQEVNNSICKESNN